MSAAGPGAHRRFDDADRRAMGRALTLARRGRSTTAPNPMVGSVVVRDNEVVGEGWHRRAGEAHAEIRALAAAGEAAHRSGNIHAVCRV